MWFSHTCIYNTYTYSRKNRHRCFFSLLKKKRKKKGQLVSNHQMVLNNQKLLSESGQAKQIHKHMWHEGFWLWLQRNTATLLVIHKTVALERNMSAKQVEKRLAKWIDFRICILCLSPLKWSAGPPLQEIGKTRNECK